LRESVDKLRAFEKMTFQEISEELEKLDRESMERARAMSANRLGALRANGN
jgi:hypothetical protein